MIWGIYHFTEWVTINVHICMFYVYVRVHQREHIQVSTKWSINIIIMMYGNIYVQMWNGIIAIIMLVSVNIERISIKYRITIYPLPK